MMKISLFLMVFLSATLAQSVAIAQSQPSNSSNTVNLDNSSSSQFNNPIPVGQTGLGLNYNGSSQQFFRQNNDQLYFLPAEKSEPILKIDKTIEAEGVNYEDLQPKPSEPKTP